MNNTERKLAVSDMIATSTELLNKYKTRLDGYSNVLLGNGFIVFQHNMGVRYTFEGKKAVNSRVCDILDANLFTKRDAINLAKNTYDGAGVAKSPMHITEALTVCIAEQEKQLNWLNDSFNSIK